MYRVSILSFLHHLCNKHSVHKTATFPLGTELNSHPPQLQEAIPPTVRSCEWVKTEFSKAQQEKILLAESSTIEQKTQVPNANRTVNCSLFQIMVKNIFLQTPL